MTNWSDEIHWELRWSEIF